jgi:hypothetical protein
MVKYAVLGVSIGYAVAVACAGAVEHGGPEQPSAQLTVICTGQLTGELERADCPTCGGGLARRHTLVRSIGLEGNPILLLENGDLTQGAGAEHELKFQTAILAMNEMGYDAFNIGEIDVTLGPRFLVNMAERAKFPFISANLAGSDGQPFFPAYVIVERVIAGKKVRVAVIGMISDQVSDYLAKLEGLDVKVLDAEQALRNALARLKGKADLTILLAHADPKEVLSLTKVFPEIDMAIYSHEAERPVEHELSTDRQIVVNSGKGGQYLARTDIILSGPGRFTHKYETLNLSDRVSDSPVVGEILDCYTRMMVEQGFLKESAIKPPERGGYYLGSEWCSGCHLEQYNIWSENRHAKAFATLENEGRQSDPACLRCHVTGYRFFDGFESLSETPELAHVGCEMCHGVGSNHTEEPTNRYGKTSRGNCKTCHDEQNSPRFSYSTYYPKIAHGKD